MPTTKSCRLILLVLPLLAAACSSNVMYELPPEPLSGGTPIKVTPKSLPQPGAGREAAPIGVDNGASRTQGMEKRAVPAVARPSFRSPDAVRNYILTHPAGAYVGQAREEFSKMDDMAWRNAQARDEHGAYAEYVQTFYDGDHVTPARSRMAELDNRSNSAECETFRASGFGADATPGSYLAKMRDDRERDLCGG